MASTKSVTWTLTDTEAELVCAALNAVEVMRPLARRLFKELKAQTAEPEAEA